VQDPTTSRHGRRQQRPPRSSQMLAAAGSTPAMPASDAWQGAQVQTAAAQGTAAAAAAGARDSRSKYRVSGLGEATPAHANLSAMAGAAAAPTLDNISSSNSSSGGSNSSNTQVYAHHMRSHRRQPHPAAAEAAAVPAAKASRHLLAEGGAEGDDGSWLDGLFGDQEGDTSDAQADAYVQKQFCGKGGCDRSLCSTCRRDMWGCEQQGCVPHGCRMPLLQQCTVWHALLTAGS
jgi:hypothetical protein